MKFSLNSAKVFTKVDLSVAELVEKVGARLAAVDEVLPIGDTYQGIVVAKVISCEPHPDADKLQVCTIDDGGNTASIKRDSDGHVRVVCGAPNCRAGLTVAWLPPGTTVPATIGKEPLVLEAREIRGVISNGMLASPKELALSDNHAGILEIDDDIEPGSDFAETFGLKDDVVLDIENKMFTHRPDLFGFLGIARELAGIQGRPFKSPDWYTSQPEFPTVSTEALPLEVKNELSELVPRFTAITMGEVQVGPSPTWLQVELAKVDQKSINNIVDYTNYFMLLTGQPLHAYDYDKVKVLSGGDRAVIVVRNPKPGEKIKLLNGKEIEPRPEAIMIATDKQLIGIGGVMGGAETEVDAKTTKIILESANFDMYSVRRTSMAHGLFTDAVTRFTKGQSPLQALAVLNRLVDEMYKQDTGVVASHEIDDNHLDPAVMERQSLHLPVKVTAEFINARLGLELSADEMKTLLENVEFRIEAKGDELTITAPFWRTDIELREDIVEEVGRLYGLDKLPLKLPQRDLTPTPKNPLFELKQVIRHRLRRAGANEVLAYSFVSADLLTKAGQDSAQAFQISNALSPDLQYYRLSLMPSLLQKVYPNSKAGYDEFALFELGKTHDLQHIDEDGLPAEFEFTGLVVTAANKLKKPGAAYYQARKYLEFLAGVRLEFKPVSEAMQQYPVVQPYDPQRSALVSVSGGDFLGIIGEFKPSVSRSFKLPVYTAGFEVDTTILGGIVDVGHSYTPLPRFPAVTQDLSLKVASDLTDGELYGLLQEQVAGLRQKGYLVEFEHLDIYKKEKEFKHITFRITIGSLEKTLTDKEVNTHLDTMAETAKTKFGAERL